MDTDLPGSNGTYASQDTMSNLSMRGESMEVKKPSGYAKGVTSKPKYQFDRTREIFLNRCCRLTAPGTDSNSTVPSNSSEQQITILKETVTVTSEKFIMDFDEVDEHYIHGMTIEQFFEYIERQRLTHMPHRGSHWDRVLKWAEFFGLQISGYANTVEPFVAESKLAAKLIWTACRALLEVRFPILTNSRSTDAITAGPG